MTTVVDEVALELTHKRYHCPQLEQGCGMPLVQATDESLWHDGCPEHWTPLTPSKHPQGAPPISPVLVDFESQA